MEEQLHRWKSKDFISQTLEKIRLDLLEDNKDSSVALNIELARNYGFIVKTTDLLTAADSDLLHEFLLHQLKEYGYRVNRVQGEEILLQASIKARVHGKQLFGSIRLVRKSYEVRVLVTPYIDSGYDEAFKRKELVDLLFS